MLSSLFFSYPGRSALRRLVGVEGLAAVLLILSAGHPSWAAATAGDVPGPVAAADPSAKSQDGDKDENKDDAKGDDKGDDDEKDDAKSYAQPVRAGDLIDRPVIVPLESQNVLGHVRRLGRDGDGDLTVVMTFGGTLGFGAHLVCVPADALALTGTSLQAKGISTDELKALPVCDGGMLKPVAADETLRFNIAKPAH
jgi:hypothetical protein